MTVTWYGDALAAAIKGAGIEAARLHGETLIGEGGGIYEKTPLDEGPLRGSLAVNDIENGAEISANTPYAHRLHESEGWTPSEPGTGPNYIRGPLLESVDELEKNISRAVAAVTK